MKNNKKMPKNICKHGVAFFTLKSPLLARAVKRSNFRYTERANFCKTTNIFSYWLNQFLIY